MSNIEDKPSATDEPVKPVEQPVVEPADDEEEDDETEDDEDEDDE